jgi:hypothetical protein
VKRKGKFMKIFKQFALAAIVAGFFAAIPHNANAQVSVSIGPQPVCPYGYYEVPPYDCAPDGYYGPEWFSSGIFIGAGPWYHGRDHFYGHVDHRFDFREGYHGHFPARGEHPSDHRAQFHGQAMHDPHGHEAPHGHR